MRKDLDQEILIRARGASTEVMSQVLSNLPNSEEDRQVLADRRAQGSGGVHASPPYRPISAMFAITPTVSVIIPARNEAANLPHVLGTLPTWVDEVVLVDGHSVDDTVAVTRALCPRAKVVTQPGRGKGDALHAGFAAATGDILVAIDADGSTDGAEIIRFVGALVAGADFAKGSRFSSSGGSDDITGVRRYGNRLLKILVNRMFGTHFTDLCYGYNAFWARHLDAVGSSSCPGFEVETLMTIRAAKAGLKIYEVPSHESPRIFGASNLHAVRDGWRILKVIMREWLGGSRKRGSHRRSAAPPAPAASVVAETVVAETVVGPYRMPGHRSEPSVPDSEIVAAIMAGDDTGVAAAFGRYAQELYSYFRSQLAEPADSADAVQNTFVIASAEVSRLSQPDRLRTWLFALARNECQLRRQGAGLSVRLHEAAPAIDDTVIFAAVTSQAESYVQVRAALDELDPVDREISELNLRHGFSGTDLADILGVAPSQAHTLASRARSRLERSLGLLLLARGEREHCPGLLGLRPAIPLPTGLRRRTLGLISDESPTAVAQRARVLDHAPRFGAGGFPVQVTTPPVPRSRVTSVPAVGAAAAAIALLGGVMYYANHPSGHDPASAAVGQPPPSAGPAGPGESARASVGAPPAAARRAAPRVVPSVPGPVVSGLLPLFTPAGATVTPLSAAGVRASYGPLTSPSPRVRLV